VYLLDTNVISELRKPRPHGAVVEWFRSVPEEELAVPAIVIGEIQHGVEATRKQDPAKAAEIEIWLDEIMDSYRVISMDGHLFREWAKLRARQSDELSADAMIAATARVHGLTVVTRNVKDFAVFGVRVLNPFKGRKGDRR
jgi:predicted nucleic acid-binding protein